MNFATGVFGAFIFFFLWRGYQKGFIGSITRILSWLIAYPAAIFLTKPLATLLFKYTPLDGMIVYFIAGSAIFFLVSFSVSKLLAKYSDPVSSNSTAITRSKIGGAVVGVLVGGIVGLLAVYAIDLTQKPVSVARQNNVSEESLYVPPQKNNISNNNPKQESTVIDSFIDTSAKKLVSTVASTAIDLTLKDTTATQLTKTFAENPQSMLGHIQELSNNGEIKTLLMDPKIQELLTNGDTNALLGNQDFQTLMNNADMQAILESVDDKATGKTAQQLAAEKMVTAWARTNAIKNDPRVIAIISDPEFQQQMNASNKIALLTNPKLKALTELIFANPEKKSNSITQHGISNENYTTNNSPESLTDTDEKSLSQNEVQTEKNPEQHIYQWTDEHGVVHYADRHEKK